MMDTNPILDELNGLSPGAKSALMGAHQNTVSQTQLMGTQPPNPAISQAQQATKPTQPPATMLPPEHQQTAPPIGLGSPQPQVKAPLGTVQGDEDERGRLLNTGSGVSQIKNPFLRGLAETGNVIGHVAAPGLMSAIPGTEEHHNLLLRQNAGQLGTDLKSNQEQAQTGLTQAQTAHTQSEIPLTEAQTAQTQALTNDIGNPKPKADEWSVDEHHEGPNGEPVEVNKATGEYRIAGQTVPGIKRYVEPSKTIPNPKSDLQGKLIAAQNSGDIASAKKIQQQLKDIDPMGEQRITIQQQGQANAQNRTMDAKTEREFNYTRSKWDKDLQSYHAQNEKLAEAGQLVGSGAMGAALGSVKALSGLAGGQGSGVRITQAELNSIAHARGYSGDFDAFLQQFGDGNKLTPQQVQALKGIISDVQRIATAKQAVLNKGLDDLSEANDTATIRKIDSQLRHVLMGQ